MKKLLIIMMVAMMAFAVSFAEITTDMTVEKFAGGKCFTFETTTDSIEIDSSRVFSLQEYDGLFTETDTNILEIPCGYSFVSASGGVKITVTLLGSFNNEDWISAVAIASNITSEATTNTVFDLAADRFPYYKVVITGVALNSPDTICKFWMYIPWPKED